MSAAAKPIIDHAPETEIAEPKGPVVVPSWPPLDEVKATIVNSFSTEQHDAIAVFMIALIFAEDAAATFDHPSLKFVRRLLPDTVLPTRLEPALQRYGGSNPQLLQLFVDPNHQTALLRLAHHFFETGFTASETGKGLNYNRLQAKNSGRDVLKDTVAYFLRTRLSGAIAEKSGEPGKVTLTDGKRQEVLIDLLADLLPDYNGAELIKHKFAGLWSQSLARVEDRLKEAVEAYRKAHPKTAIKVVYLPHTLSKNPLIKTLDESIGFPKRLTEQEAYTLCGIVGHAASSDGAQTDAAEAKWFKGLMKRLQCPLDGETLGVALSKPIEQLLAAAKGFEFTKAVYYETLCIITANLDVSPEEKKFLDRMATVFAMPEPLTLKLHTRLYLDSGMRGVEDSLAASPVFLEHSQKAMHKYQDLLSEMAIVPLSEIVRQGEELLDAMEPMGMPKDAPDEVRVAVMSLVGNAMRLDNVFDENEKNYLTKVMAELSITSEMLKTHSRLMKQCSVQELCGIVKAWFVAGRYARQLPGVAYHVLCAIGADGVIDAKEEKFKDIVLAAMGLDTHQYARVLLRTQLNAVLKPAT